MEKEVSPKRNIYFYDFLKSKVEISKIKYFDPNKLNQSNLEKSDLENTDNFFNLFIKDFGTL